MGGLTTDHLTGEGLAGWLTERVEGDVLSSVLVENTERLRASPAHRDNVVTEPPGRASLHFNGE